MTLEQFAEWQGLTLEHHDRGAGPLPRYYVMFSSNVAQRFGRAGIIWKCGNGSCPACAVRDYAKAISGDLLIVDSGLPTRREIQVPQLT